MKIVDWLKCPGCHRTGTVGLVLDEKMLTAKCNACGERTSDGFGFRRPVEFGPWRYE